MIDNLSNATHMWMKRDGGTESEVSQGKILMKSVIEIEKEMKDFEGEWKCCKNEVLKENSTNLTIWIWKQMKNLKI